MVIVIYQPDRSRVEAMLKTAQQAGIRAIIVDNSETPVTLSPTHGATLLSMGENRGIAEAQNAGIRYALQDNSEALIFFDQDSRISVTLLHTLLEALAVPEPRIVAPVFFDEKKGFEYPAIRVGAWGFRTKVYPSSWPSPAPVDIVISSGSAANRAAMEQVGLMDESLFIDYVDTEWCLRARHQGLAIDVLPAARMWHSIGDNSLDLRIARVPVHSAQRRYYRVRNAVFLLRKPHVPKLLALREIVFAFIHQMIILLAMPGRRQYLYFFLKALGDALRGREGKIR